MTADPYGDEVRRLFAEPRHAGTVDGGVSVLEDAQGVRVELSATTAGGRIATLRFRVWGCPHLIAAAEAFCAEFEGRDVAGLEVFRAAPMKNKLGVPAEKTGRILVLEDAVRSLQRALSAQ